jgi:transaldolase
MGIKIFLDSADIAQIAGAATNGSVSGFTTNPSLMRRAGVSDYLLFARDAVAAAQGLPISFEVLSDGLDEMEREARLIASWGENVLVKVPVSTPSGESALPLIRKLSAEGIALNVTALLTETQVAAVVAVLTPRARAIVSVFAGRIADCGRDPLPVMRRCATLLSSHAGAELLWASSRELFNVVQAEGAGCGIITLTPDLLAKVPLLGRNIEDYSLETVRQLHADAHAAGYVLA